MTATHSRHHICRAALESIAYQTKDVFDAITADSGVTLTELKVDGGGTANQLLVSFHSESIIFLYFVYLYPCPTSHHTFSFGYFQISAI